MKKTHLAIVLGVMMFYETGNNQRTLTPPSVRSVSYNNVPYDTAVEIHQGEQDGGGALW